jgi:anti-sigma B factor antagonist
VVIRPLNRLRAGLAGPAGEAPSAGSASGESASGESANGDSDGRGDGAVITAQRTEALPLQVQVQVEPVQLGPIQLEPVQLELSCRTGLDGYRVISVTGELDIATADKAYAYISEVIDSWQVPVTVDLSGLTFCDASGLGVLAKVARHARQAGRQLKLTAARPSLLKIMRMTGMDRAFPELRPSAPAYSVLPARGNLADRSTATIEDAARWR